MYFFYIDETGNLDLELKKVRGDNSILNADWLYVLTAIGFFEGRWKRFHHYITMQKTALY